MSTLCRVGECADHGERIFHFHLAALVPMGNEGVRRNSGQGVGLK
jgi:hypothetical protein